MYIVCLDLEGVLVPEIWIAFSRKTGIKELSLTTRDISDYDVLMKKRLTLLEENNLKLRDIQNVINSMEPMEGAGEFLNALRERCQVIILSDTFSEFAKPLMRKLGFPTLFCNSLVIDSGGMVRDYKLRQKDGKFHAVAALKNLGYTVFAAGDSYNDLTMIKKADRGALFRAPENIISENPSLPAVESYNELLEIVDSLLDSEGE